MNPYNAYILITTLIIALSGCAPTQVRNNQAIDPDIVPMSGFGGNAASGSLVGVKPLTLEELTQCAVMIDKANKYSAQLKVRHTEIASKNAKLKAQVKHIDAWRPRVNTRSLKQVKAFNSAISQNRSAISQFNAVVQGYNVKVNEFNSRNNDFTISCAQRSYRQSDVVRLAADLRLAVESKSEKSDIPLIDENNTDIH